MLSFQKTALPDRNDFWELNADAREYFKKVNLQRYILNKKIRIRKVTIVNYNLVSKLFKMIIEVSDTLLSTGNLF